MQGSYFLMEQFKRVSGGANFDLAQSFLYTSLFLNFYEICKSCCSFHDHFQFHFTLESVTKPQRNINVSDNKCAAPSDFLFLDPLGPVSGSMRFPSLIDISHVHCFIVVVSLHMSRHHIFQVKIITAMCISNFNLVKFSFSHCSSLSCHVQQNHTKKALA